MREHTIRNKAANPIVTLTPQMLEKMLAARPESVSLTLAKFVKDYKQITGKRISVDHVQQQILSKHAGADERGSWSSRYSELPYPQCHLQPIFADGFLSRTSSKGFSEDLVMAEAFFALLDSALTINSVS